MPKAFRRLCLLSLMTLAVAAAVASGPRSAAASEPCRIRFDACEDPLMDCCCGFKHICIGPEGCADFCG